MDGCCDHLFGVRCDSSLIFKHLLQVVSIKSTVVEVLRIMKEASWNFLLSYYLCLIKSNPPIWHIFLHFWCVFVSSMETILIWISIIWLWAYFIKYLCVIVLEWRPSWFEHLNIIYIILGLPIFISIIFIILGLLYLYLDCFRTESILIWTSIHLLQCRLSPWSQSEHFKSNSSSFPEFSWIMKM